MKHHSTDSLCCALLDFGRRDVLFTEERIGREARVGVPPAGVDRTISHIYFFGKGCQIFF